MKWCIGITVDPGRGVRTQKGPDDARNGRIFRASAEIGKGQSPKNRTDVEVLFEDNSTSYVEYARNDFIYGLSGHLFHNGISELSAISLINRLCKQAKDEEADARLDVVSETYKKGKTGKPIRGVSQLRYLLAKYNDESEIQTNEIIAELNQALGIAIDSSSSGTGTSSTDTLGREDPVAQAIVQNRMEISSLRIHSVNHML